MIHESLIQNLLLSGVCISSTNLIFPEESVPISYFVSTRIRPFFFAKKNGLILVDTKYEIGTDSSGKIKFVDEIHTPDSSRFWISDS